MNKAEIIEKIAQETEVSKAIIEKVINSEQDVIKKAVASGEKVKYVGFGTFEARPQAAKNVKNPRTKKEQFVDAKMVPKFNASKEFKDTVESNLEYSTSNK